MGRDWLTAINWDWRKAIKRPMGWGKVRQKDLKRQKQNRQKEKHLGLRMR